MNTFYKLVLAEKPSVAGSIAAVLCGTRNMNQHFSEGSNFARGQNCAMTEGKMLDSSRSASTKQRGDGFFHGGGYVVSWCFGHLVELADPAAYDEQSKRWSRDTLPILPETWKFTAYADKKKQFDVIRGLMNRADVDGIICATDAGREQTIGTFTSAPFYTPVIECGIGTEGAFTAVGERQNDLAAAEIIHAAADGREAVVVSVEKSKKTAVPPKLYDLTTLQRDANRLLGYTAQQTLDYLQSLYERKLTTYPRVDSQYLTEDMAGTAKAVIRAVSGVYPFADAFSFVPDIPRVIDNAKVSDHHAIIPTIEVSKVDLTALPVGERDLLAL